MQTIGSYQIESLIGEGAFAHVYRAVDTKLDRPVALKVLKPFWRDDPNALARFRREAETMASLDHPHIVTLYEVGEARGQVYLAQKLIDGESLAERLIRSPLSWGEMLAVLQPIAGALDAAHAQSFIHRDLKPSNILLGQDGTPYLSDFGLVRAAEGSTKISSSTGGIIGTPAYMAPEQWEMDQPASPATDVYALACVVVEMLTGHVLFDGPTPAKVMKQHLMDGPRLPETWPAGVPDGVPAVLHKCLAQNSAERFNNVGAFLEALLAQIDTIPTDSGSDKHLDVGVEDQPAISTKIPDRPKRQSARKQNPAPSYFIVLAFTVLVIILAAIGITVLLWRQDSITQPPGLETAGLEQPTPAPEQTTISATETTVLVTTEPVTATETVDPEPEGNEIVKQSGRLARLEKLIAKAQTSMLAGLPQRSLLLATEAMNFAMQFDGIPLAPAENVMWQMLTNTGGQSLGSHSDAVTAIQISPDNRWLITAGGDTARLWDITNLSAEPDFLPMQSGPISAVAVSPDSQWLAIAADVVVYLWHLTEPAASQKPVILRSHREAITALAISPDSRWLVTGAGNSDNTVRIWDLNNPAATPTILSPQESPVQAIAISADSRRLVVTGSFDPAIRVWDLTDLNAPPLMLSMEEGSGTSNIVISSDNQTLIISGNDTYLWNLTNLASNVEPTVLTSNSFVNAIVISLDNRWLAVGNQDNTVHVWDLTSLDDGAMVLHGHSGPINRLDISPDNHWLASGSVDHTVQLWDLSDLQTKPVTLKGHDAAITALKFSPDSRWLATGSVDGIGRLWDVTRPSPAQAAPIILPDDRQIPVTKISVSPDNNWLVSANAERDIYVWDLTTARGDKSKDPDEIDVIQTGHLGTITKLAISPDSRWLVSASEDSNVHLWELSNTEDQDRITLSGHTAAITAMAIDPGNNWLVTGSDDATVRLWDLNEPGAGSAITLPDHEGAITAIAISNDSRWLATVGGNSPIQLWDLPGIAAADTLVTAARLTGHQGFITAMTISSDNTWLVAGDDTGAGYLWDLHEISDTTASPIVLSGHNSRITTVAVSPDNHWLAASGIDGVTDLWDLPAISDSGEIPPITLRGHESGILATSISADNRWVATASFDGTARLWDLSRAGWATEFAMLKHEQGVFDLAFSSDNHWLATAGADGATYLWSMQAEELTELACHTLGRNLSQAEWDQLFPGEAHHPTCVSLPLYLSAR